MLRPEQYPIQSPHRLNPPPHFPTLQSPQATSLNDEKRRIPIPQYNSPANQVQTTLVMRPNIQQNHGSVPHMSYNAGPYQIVNSNTAVYHSKPNSPVVQTYNEKQKPFSHSQFVGSPKSVTSNNLSSNNVHREVQGRPQFQNPSQRQIQNQKVTFNYNMGSQLQHLPMLPPAQPREMTISIQPGVVHQTVVHTQIIWERRFIEIYTKFEIFVQRFEVMIEEVYIIEDQFDSVNDEQGWNELRSRYAELMHKCNTIREEIINVLEENKKAIESISPEILEESTSNNNQNENEEQEQNDDQEGDITCHNSNENLWEHRYYELMQQHDVLSQEYNQIREEFEAHAQREEESGQDQNNRNQVMELQNNLNTLHAQYEELGENYTKLEEAYNQAMGQLQHQSSEWNQEQAQKIIESLEEQIHHSGQNIQYLEQQLQLANAHKTNPNDQQLNVFQARIEELLEEKNILIKNMNEMKNQLEQYDEELNRRQQIIEDQSNRIEALQEHIGNEKKIGIMDDNSLKQELHNAIETLKENERSLSEYRRAMAERERVLEDIARNRDDIARENQEFFDRIQEYDREMMGKSQSVERLERRIQRLIEEQEQSLKESTNNSGVDNEKLKMEVESAVAEKNRKIRSLTQELEDANSQISKLQSDKEKAIKKIKDYFVEEEERKDKMIQEKDNNIRILSDKVRSLEHELSNRNLEISRFRHQPGTNSFSNEESKKLSQNLQKKNIQIQKLRRSYEQKCLDVKELEQKIDSIQHELSSKVFETNTLKREAYEFHGIKSEIESQNALIKKKNQQINDLRLKVIESEQIQVNYANMERQKTRLNELLKQRSKENQNRDSTIQNLQKKLNNLRLQIGASVPTVSKSSTDTFNTFDNGLIKQKEAEIRKIKNQLQIKDAKIETHEKTIKQKQSKIVTQQKANNMLKAEIQNKINRYENEIKNLQKQIKQSRHSKEDNLEIIDSMKAKISSLQNSLEERNVVYDHEIALSKQKMQSIEQNNTNLMIEREMTKTALDRQEKQNRNLSQKIKSLQQKLESKNKFISDLKSTFQRKQKDEAKGYQEKIKQLDGEKKLDFIKMKNLQEIIQQLNHKIKEVEIEKKSYRERLLTEHSGDRDMQFRFMTEYNDTMPNLEVFEMERFKVRDTDSNNVFERKVIYDLKKENDMLRRELSGVGYSSVSLNRFQTQNQLSIYQQESATEQDHRPEDDHHAQVLLYHKNVNKELQQRIDELIKVNRQLKEKMELLSGNNNNMSSVQFYKEQNSQLELEVASLQKKIKQLISENQAGKSQTGQLENEMSEVNKNNTELSKQINELKFTIRSFEMERAEMESSKAILKAEITRLNSMLQKEMNQSKNQVERDRAAKDFKRKCEQLEQQMTKMTNKHAIMKAEIERLSQILLKKENQNQQAREKHSREIIQLNKRIFALERQIEMGRQQTDPTLRYKLQLLRSLYLEVESVAGEIPRRSKAEETLSEAIFRSTNQGLRVISTIPCS